MSSRASEKLYPFWFSRSEENLSDPIFAEVKGELDASVHCKTID